MKELFVVKGDDLSRGVMRLRFGDQSYLSVRSIPTTFHRGRQIEVDHHVGVDVQQIVVVFESIA
jgi:hypothetical protein